MAIRLPIRHIRTQKSLTKKLLINCPYSIATLSLSLPRTKLDYSKLNDRINLTMHFRSDSDIRVYAGRTTPMLASQAAASDKKPRFAYVRNS